MRFLVFIGLILFTLTFQDCGAGVSDAEKVAEYQSILMSKPWRYDEAAILEASDFSQMAPHQADAIRTTTTRLAGGSISFMPDSVLILTLHDGSRAEGIWFLTDDAKMLYMQASASRGQPQYVREITEDRVFLENDVQEGFVFPKILIPRVQE